MSDQTTREPYIAGDGQPGGKSAGQLMKEVTEDLSTLIRKEIELAKQELSESMTEKAKGAAAIAIAAFLGFFALIFVLLMLRDAFDDIIGTHGDWAWLADGLTALVLVIVGAVGALWAKKKLSTPVSTELTKKTIKDDVETIKSLGKR
jgi:uncharacterized membrane protein YqjE